MSDLSPWLSPRIDKKMSDAQGSYKLDEAQAVLRETKAIKKAITCGEKEKQDLIKVQDLPVTGAPSQFLIRRSGRGRGIWICISTKFIGATDTAGLGTTLWKSLLLAEYH